MEEKVIDWLALIGCVFSVAGTCLGVVAKNQRIEYEVDRAFQRREDKNQNNYNSVERRQRGKK